MKCFSRGLLFVPQKLENEFSRSLKFALKMKEERKYVLYHFILGFSNDEYFSYQKILKTPAG